MALTRYEIAVLADKPSLWWRMADADTTAQDASGNGRAGTYTGVTTKETGPLVEGGSSRALDGSTGRLSSAYDPFVPGANVTLEAWVRRNTTTDGDAIMGSESGSASGQALLRLQSGADTLNFYPQASAAASWPSCGVGTGAWHHVAVTFDNAANTAIAYVDGVSLGSKAMADDFVTGATFCAGVWRQVVTYKDYFNGDLAEIAVYPTVLSAERIRDHYLAGVEEPWTLGDKTRAILDALPAYYWDDVPSLRVLDTLCLELQRLEDAAKAIVDGTFVQNATDEYGMLGFHEQLLGLPVEPSGVTLAERTNNVKAAYRKRDAAAGSSWMELVTQALGTTLWSHVETPATYQLTIVMPAGASSYTGAQVVALLSDITPANLQLAFGYDDGFLLSISQLGDTL